VSKQRSGPRAKAEPASAFKAPEAKQPAVKQAKPSLDDKNRPAGIERPVAVDDLKLISGVGPKIEGTLHSLGIYTFAQVASWKKAERDWVDAYLSFHGRIERDDWVKQAKALAKGGVAEYIRVFGKKPV
ncbi:MAG: NADH-quinone oxidoreductase subunit E, partial [Mesorhizobium sp.]